MKQNYWSCFSQRASNKFRLFPCWSLTVKLKLDWENDCNLSFASLQELSPNLFQRFYKFTEGAVHRKTPEVCIFIKKRNVVHPYLSQRRFGRVSSVHFQALRIHWRFSTILNTSNKSVWSNVFWNPKVGIFWKCIQYTIHTNVKKFSAVKIDGTKVALFFLSGATTHHSLIFKSWF